MACRASLSTWPLPPGPDSPVSPLKELKELKEVKELTFAVRKQQRALEERLEGCLEELRALCLREAVSSVARVTPTHGLLGSPGVLFWDAGLREGRILEVRWGNGARSPCWGHWTARGGRAEGLQRDGAQSGGGA